MSEDHTDLPSERNLLAAALRGSLDAFLTVPPEAFVHWVHADIASAIRKCHAAEVPVDMANVARYATLAASTPTRAATLGAKIAEIGTYPVVGDGSYYAERITEQLNIRSMLSATEKFKREIDYASQNDDESIHVQALKGLREAADLYEASMLRLEAPVELDSVRSLLDEPDEEYDWLVPGLMERQDRLILTGFEGTGKSYLLAQMALCIGAGIHPFTQDPLPQDRYRVLVLDAENARHQVKRRYRWIVRQIGDIRERNDMGPVDWSVAVRPWIKQEGFDLTDLSTLAEIHRLLETVQPDLVVAGPLYKMSRLNVQEEQAAQELTLCLDELRAKYGFALICEAHAGHATDGVSRKVRPIGSSLFLRWPEFGFGIVPHPDAPEAEHPEWVQIRHWRGSREERDWPDALKHGQLLPWEPLDDQYYARVRARTW